MLLILACADPPAPPPRDPHVAGAVCGECHAEAVTAWQASNHARAMGREIDLSRFDGKPVTFGALTVTPDVEAGKAVLRIDETWQVTGTIGVAPLQQYLLEGERGKVVVAPIAWHLPTGRWIDPAPQGVVTDPTDPLYWAGIAGNWNHLCAECHTTGYQKGYDPDTDSYTTQMSHPNVACAACHGDATKPLALGSQVAQVQACAPCHSRRATLSYGGGPEDPFLDHHRPALIGSVVYGPDGANLAPDEPFEWGAFVQSRMYAAGVRCTDCHDPHGPGMRYEGDALCERCHDPHEEARTDCVSCHMPVSTYMTVDTRHDHGFRVPGDTRHAAAFGPALQGDPSSVPALVAVLGDPKASAFERASAAAALRAFPPMDPAPLRALAASTDPLLRTEAVATLVSWGDADTGVAALGDPVRAVRFAAFEGLVALRAIPGSPTFAAVQDDYVRTALQRGDTPAAWQNILLARAAVNDLEGVAHAVHEGLERDPGNEALRRFAETLDKK